MSSIVEQLRREIADVTTGVVVTERDLMRARDSLEGRIDNSRRRTRLRVLAVAVAAAVVIPVVGLAAIRSLGAVEEVEPAGSGPTGSDSVEKFLNGSAPTPEQLEGAWRVDNGTILVRFSAPDRVSFDNTGRLFSKPAITGTYQLAGDVITVSVDGGWAACPGPTLIMRASVARPDSVRVAHTGPAISGCIPSTSRWVLEQLLPTSQPWADWDPSSGTTEADWAAGVEASELPGDWMAEGGGYLLEFALGRTYVVADASGAVVDQGQWSKRGAEITLTSSGAALDCAEGDQLVLAGVEHFIFESPSIRGNVRQNDCGGAWASEVWWMLPDSSN